VIIILNKLPTFINTATGDNFNVAPVAIILILAMVAAVVAFIILRKK
jgi:LPXTG-motif cell wall-anchored protein